MVVVMILSVWYMFTIGLSVTKSANTNSIVMNIPKTNGLQDGSRVLLRGIEVGYVTDVKPSLDGVEVTWNFKKDYKIPRESTYRVDNLSALGETYLGVFPEVDRGPWLSDGSVLDTTQVAVPTTVDELSERVTRLMNQVDVAAVSGLIDEVNTGLAPDGTTITNLARGSRLLQNTFLSTRPDFETVLDKMQVLFKDGSTVSAALRAAGPPARPFGSNFAEVLGGFGKVVVVTGLPETLDHQIGDFLKNLEAFLAKASPDLKILGDATLPAVIAATDKLKMVDLSELMQTALRTAGRGDGLVLGVK
ncbi:MlaD family protein [Gordonia hydrophobica]|uniref:MlaD family protein n=1 Tax=Gordonia hydrophobica TaxID=40516 RepID=A0ABZ2TZF3_9ACTN|nr:MlaD family protein [Gordonia hydrophobica]MBM7368843.1 virulence factor Mce-like protein [Gordonia hydrophobica]